MSSNLAYSYLVPIDFTEKSIHALEYAAAIIKKHDGMIHLLHVIDERSQPQTATLDAIRERTAQFAREQQQRLGVNIVSNVVAGNIFISIGASAEKLGVQLIVMGIHGMTGIQFIIGSFAARVILGSPVPVVLTNGSKTFEGFRNIVLPFDAELNMKQLVGKTIELGLLFNSTIHLYSKNEEVSFWKRQKNQNTIKNTLQLIRKAGLPCQNVVLDSKDDQFADSILKYASNVDADLIMVTTHNQLNSKEYIIMEMGTRLMEKSKTPLFFINPKPNP